MWPSHSHDVTLLRLRKVEGHSCPRAVPLCGVGACEDLVAHFVSSTRNPSDATTRPSDIDPEEPCERVTHEPAKVVSGISVYVHVLYRVALHPPCTRGIHRYPLRSKRSRRCRDLGWRHRPSAGAETLQLHARNDNNSPTMLVSMVEDKGVLGPAGSRDAVGSLETLLKVSRRWRPVSLETSRVRKSKDVSASPCRRDAGFPHSQSPWEDEAQSALTG